MKTNLNFKGEIQMKKAFSVFFLALFFLAAIITGIGTARADDGHYSRHEHHRYGIKKDMFKIIKKLGLTNLQFKKLKLIKKKEIKAFKMNSEHSNQIIGALKSGNFSKEVFVSDAMNNARKHIEIKASFFDNFFRILTPLQRQKFINIIKNKMMKKLEHLKLKEKMIENKIKAIRHNMNN